MLGKIEAMCSMTSVQEIESAVIELFNDFKKEVYLPVYINYKRKSDDKFLEFYMKGVLVPLNFEVNESWIVCNLTNNYIVNCILDDTESIETGFHGYKHIFNILTNRNYKDAYYLQANPLLWESDNIVEKGNINLNSFNYIDQHMHSNDELNTSVFKVIHEDDLEVFCMHKDILCMYEDTHSVYMEFELIRRNRLGLFGSSTDNFTKKTDLGFYDICLGPEYKVFNRVTVGIAEPFSYNIENSTCTPIVFGINREKKKYNPNNYNDDIEIGFIYFDIACLEFLSKYYNYIGLNLRHKSKDITVIVDILEDTVMFFEGEYNKLSDVEKQGLQKFNKTSNIEYWISEYMYKWQLFGAGFDIKQLSNIDKLGMYLENNYNIQDKDISFIGISDIDTYKRLIDKLECILELNILDAALKLIEGKVNIDYMVVLEEISSYILSGVKDEEIL